MKYPSPTLKAYFALYTLHKSSSQKGQDHFIDYDGMFHASDETLPHTPADVTPYLFSPVDTVIDELAKFMDILARKTDVHVFFRIYLQGSFLKNLYYGSLQETVNHFRLQKDDRT